VNDGEKDNFPLIKTTRISIVLIIELMPKLSIVKVEIVRNGGDHSEKIPFPCLSQETILPDRLRKIISRNFLTASKPGGILKRT
jgi:hypothetical protein